MAATMSQGQAEARVYETCKVNLAETKLKHHSVGKLELETLLRM